MSETISAKLTAIDAEIHKIDSSVKEAVKNTKSFQSGLRLDGNNLQLIADKFASMRDELQYNTELVKKYKAAIEETRSLQSGLDTSSETYKQDFAKYSKDLESYTAGLKKAEAQVTGLSTATSKYAENQALAKAATANTKSQFEKFEKTAKQLSVTMLALVGIMATLVKSAITSGTELYSLSKQFQTNVEDIQKWNKALQLATGESDLFTSSLSTMQNNFSKLTTGSGTVYANTLKKIGLSFSELSNLDNTSRFESIINALAEVENANDRAAHAQTLFGESGLSIANTLEQGSEALSSYLERAEEFNLITQKGAEQLNELNSQFDLAKSKISEAGADITIAFAPALLTLADIIEEDVAPFLKDVADFLDKIGENGQKILLAAMIAIIVLPKLIGMIQSTKTAIDLARESTTLLNVATAGWQVVLLAVAAVVLTIISLIAIFSKSAKDALDDANNISEAAEALTGAGFDYAANVQRTATETSTKTVIVEATVTGKGDTAISDESAMTIAQLTADEINKQLGDLIK